MASFLPLQIPVPYTNVGRLASAPVQIKKQNSKLFFSQESIDHESPVQLQDQADSAFGILYRGATRSSSLNR